MDLKPRSMHGRLPALISPDNKYHGRGLRLSRLALRKVRWKHLILLGIVWVLTIHYFERTVVYRAFNKCRWSNWEKWSDDSYPHHAVVIGDPQIVDAFSYPTRPRPLMALTRILADNYLHRNYEIMNRVLNQHSTLFVGDLFDGGREWDDTDWFEEYARFHRVFNKQSKNRAYMQVPGNHDVGFGSGIRYDRYKRFVTYFGDANTYITLGNHSIVLLDTVSLSDTENIMVSKSSTEFLNSLEDDNHPSKQYPRIVITHVPLYRSPDLLTCGPFRESTRPFPIVRGNQYQTVIDYTFTRHILDWIKPKLVLSGDDHDYCHVRHPINRPGLNKEDHTYEEGKASIGKDFADEITVKSSAMTGGIKRPAVQLLSLWNPDGTDKNPAVSEPWEETGSQTILHDTFESELCYLPDFLRPLICYGILAAFSFISLFSCTVMPRQTARLEKIVRNLSRLGSTDILPLSQGESNGFRAKQPGQKFLTKLLLDWELPLKPDWQAFLIHLTIWIGFVIFTFYWSITAI